VTRYLLNSAVLTAPGNYAYHRIDQQAAWRLRAAARRLVARADLDQHGDGPSCSVWSSRREPKTRARSVPRSLAGDYELGLMPEPQNA
jgi:hypothetical protein